MRMRLSLFLFLLINFSSSFVFAQRIWRTNSSSRALGMGGAVIGNATGMDSIIHNPAAMSLIRSYIWENNYRYNTSLNESSAQSALVDSFKNPRFALGLFYEHQNGTIENYYNGAPIKKDYLSERGGMGMSILFSQNFAAGLNGYYYVYDDGVNDKRIKDFSMDFGLVTRLGKTIVFGAAAYDVLSDHDDAHPYAFGAGLSVNLIPKKLLLAADVVLEDKKPWYRGAGEFFIPSIGMALRAGGGYRGWNETAYFSGGLGYISKKSSIEIGLQQDFKGSAATVVCFNLRFYIR